MRSVNVPHIVRVGLSNIYFLRKMGLARLIIADGMPRSGSTLVFNVLRLILQSDPRLRLTSGWIGDIATLPSGDTYLIKIHGPDLIKVVRADHIIYSYRDVRDALISNHLRFGVEPSFEIAAQWIQHYQRARNYADIMLRYETMVEDFSDAVKQVAALFQVRVDPSSLLKNINLDKEAGCMSNSYDRTTLFHKNHATEAPSGEWRRLLDLETINNINEEFEWWFAENGYPIK